MNETQPIDKLEDHIDDPIKKCVAGMALLGFKPEMSCCGFSYKTERVPKKHLEKAYIFLDYKDLINNKLGTLLLQVGMQSGWDINLVNGEIFVDFYAPTWENRHPWNDLKCPHFYEKFIIAISRLEKTLIGMKEHFKDSVVIRDGNNYYKENVSKYWQYEPTQDWEVTPEIFERL